MTVRSSWKLCGFAFLLVVLGRCAYAADYVQARLFGVRPGESETLDTLSKRWGPAPKWHTGDAAESETKICYLVNGGKAGAMIVVFLSSSEMANPSGQITTIRLSSPADAGVPARNCARISANKLKPLGSLRLGATRSALTALYGKGHGNQALLTYESCRKKYLVPKDSAYPRLVGRQECFKDPSRPYLDDCSRLAVKFKSNRATVITLSDAQSAC